MSERKYRVYFHYYRQYKCMSVHFKGQCFKTDNVDCRVPVETKWNKTQPNLVMQGWATNLTQNKNKIIIE